MTNPSRILFILPTTSNTRMAKRIDMLLAAGYDVEALAFKRDDLRLREFNCRIETIGSVRNASYARRIPGLLRAALRVRRALRRNELAYVFNSDMALLAHMAGFGLARPVVLEVADIKEVQVADTIASRLLRKVERLTVGRCKMLVLITEEYMKYFDGWLGVKTPFVEIRSKHEPGLAQRVQSECWRGFSTVLPDNRPIRVGWFGMLRDDWIMDVLESLTTRHSERFRVVLGGSGRVRDFDARVKAQPAMKYLGEYPHPFGLIDMYRQVDMVMAGKSPEVPHNWSITNRFYDSCLFRRPMIVRGGSGDSRLVQEYDLGLVIHSSEPESAAAEIASVTPAQWQKWHDNLTCLPVEHYLTGDDVSVLDSAIRDALNA